MARPGMAQDHHPYQHPDVVALQKRNDDQAVQLKRLNDFIEYTENRRMRDSFAN
jgi:hypothetical protein